MMCLVAGWRELARGDRKAKVQLKHVEGIILFPPNYFVNLLKCLLLKKKIRCPIFRCDNGIVAREGPSDGLPFKWLTLWF